MVSFKKVIASIAVLLAVSSCCKAETVVHANTDVYVRSKTGEIVGAMYKGDTALYCGEKKGWVYIEINGEKFKVWNEYVFKEEVEDISEMKFSKVRKSKSAGKIKNKRSSKIKGSVFEDVYFW